MAPHELRMLPAQARVVHAPGTRHEIVDEIHRRHRVHLPGKVFVPQVARARGLQKLLFRRPALALEALLIRLRGELGATAAVA